MAAVDHPVAHRDQPIFVTLSAQELSQVRERAFMTKPYSLSPLMRADFCSCRILFDQYTFSKLPGFIESEMRKEFKKAVPLRTIVVYCYDPRAVNIPHIVAKAMPDEVYPGEIVTDREGKKIASTATVFSVVVAGGRAVDALRSITVAQHLFGIKNIVVVHHTYCGATSFTPEGLIQAFRKEQGADISTIYDRANIAIPDYESSLKRDTQLVRESKGTPRNVNIYGYLYNIDTDALTLVVEDRAAQTESPALVM